MDVGINALIDRWAWNPQQEELEAMWRRSEHAHREKLRRENRARWYGYHCHLEELHAALSEEHRAKALALLEGPGGG